MSGWPGDALFGPMFTTRAMASAVSDRAWVAAMLRFEAALAAAQGRLGVIPPDVAATIEEACGALAVDPEAIGTLAAASATPVIPLLDALRAALPPESRGHVHHGATSQDALDSAMMLVAHDATALLAGDLHELAARCADLAERYRAQPMTGRTLLQAARTTTFGAKAAGWLSSVLGALRRLHRVQSDDIAVQLGGPVGTLDAFGGRGAEVVAEIARELDLRAPEIAWHADRRRVSEIAGALAGAAACADKIALDLILLSQAEVGEVAEASPGGSSSMPGKANAARSVEARAAAAAARGFVGVLLGAASGEHERAAGAWQSEWPALSGAFRAAAGTVGRCREALTDLDVKPAAMAENLARAGLSAEPDAVAAAVRLVDEVLKRYGYGEA